MFKFFNLTHSRWGLIKIILLIFLFTIFNDFSLNAKEQNINEKQTFVAANSKYSDLEIPEIIKLKRAFIPVTDQLNIQFKSLEAIFDNSEIMNKLFSDDMNLLQNTIESFRSVLDGSISIKQKYSNLSFDLFNAINNVSWMLNLNGFFCATEYPHCFAIYIEETKETFPTVVINWVIWNQEKDEDTKTIGILHEGLSAAIGNIDFNYQVSLLLWYINYLNNQSISAAENESNPLSGLEELINLNKQHYYVMKSLPKGTFAQGGGGSSGVGGGDFASIKLKKQLLIMSFSLWKKISKNVNKCRSLVEFQNLILNLRVEPSHDIIVEPYWDKHKDILFTKISSILDHESWSQFYLNKIAYQLIVERGCHVKN